MKDAELKVKLAEMQVAAYRTLQTCLNTDWAAAGYKSKAEMLLGTFLNKKKQIDNFMRDNLEDE